MDEQCHKLLEGAGLGHLMGDTITMPKKAFVKEHRALLKILKKGDPKELKREYKEQKAEMHRYGIKGGNLTKEQMIEYDDKLNNELEYGKHEDDAWALVDELLPKLRRMFPEDGDLMMSELDELREKAPAAQKRTLARHALGALLRVLQKHI